MCNRYTRCLQYSTNRWFSAAIILGIPVAFLLSIVSNQLMSPLPDSLAFAYIPNFIMFGVGSGVFIGACIGRAYRIPVFLTIGSMIYRLLACACFAYLVVTIRAYLNESFISRSGDTMLVSYIVCVPTFVHAGAAMWVMGTSPIPSTSAQPRVVIQLRNLLRPRDIQLLPT